MTSAIHLKQGEKIGPHFESPLPNSRDIIADQRFLAEVFQLGIRPLSGNSTLSDYFSLLLKYAEFSDREAAPVNRALTRFSPDILYEDEQARYRPETRTLFQNYAAQGFIGIAANPKYGNDADHRGSGLPEALLPGIAMLGFNDNPSFYLKEMVTQGVLKLLQAAIDHETAQDNQPKLAMLNNIFSKIIQGKYTGAMLLTEPQTGSNLGNDMETYATIPDGTDQVRLNGQKKYITGLTTGGIDTVENAIGIVVSATKNQNGELLITKDGKTAASVSLVPLYKLDKAGNTILPRQLNDITTSRPFDKPGIRYQILQMHDFVNSEATMLGERGKGWEMMFKIMDCARMEVGAQACGHVYTAFTFVSDYVTKRGADTVDGESYAQKFPEVRANLNLMRAFAQAAAAMLMRAGQDLDLSHAAGGTDIERSEARALVKLQSPLLKAFLTNHAVALVNDAAVLMGSDGFISPPDSSASPMTQLQQDLRPTRFYEGANPMMAKQIVFQQFFLDKEKTQPRMDVFTRQTDAMLETWDRSENADVRNMVRSVREASRELAAATAWISDQHKVAQSGSPDAGEAVHKIQAASASYVDLFGRVFMGREAVCIAEHISRELPYEKGIAEGKDLAHRFLLAQMAIHEFIDKSCPRLVHMKEAYRFTPAGPDIEEMIATASETLEPRRTAAREDRAHTVLIT